MPPRAEASAGAAHAAVRLLALSRSCGRRVAPAGGTPRLLLPTRSAPGAPGSAPGRTAKPSGGAGRMRWATAIFGKAAKRPRLQDEDSARSDRCSLNRVGRPELRAAAGQEAAGGRDPASRPRDRKKKSLVPQRVLAVTAHPVSAICRVLGMARQTAYYVLQPRPAATGPGTTPSCSRSARSRTAGPHTAIAGSGRWSTGTFAPATTVSGSAASCAGTA